MKFRVMLSLGKTCVAMLMALAVSACLPTNSLKGGSFPNPAANSTLGSGGLPTSTANTAPIPCNMIDPSNPQFAICMGCYKSVLNSKCPGQQAFSTCLDADAKANYINYVNQCISQTTVAGFTCPVTTCSNGLVLNPSTCTCIPPSPAPLTGGFAFVDVGQTDFGPPIVGAALPLSSTYGVPIPSPTVNVTPTSCVGASPLWMEVINRGNTVFRLNQYGMPQSVNATPNPAGQPYLPQPSPVAPLLTTQLQFAPPGANAASVINFQTAGSTEIIGKNGTGVDNLGNALKTNNGLPSVVKTLSGTGQSSAGADANTYHGAVGTAWTSPGYGARDLYGNIYFSDPASHVIRVICYQPGRTPAGQWCNGAQIGSIWTIVGITGAPGYVNGANAEANKYVNTFATNLNSPHGIALDQFQNMIIADSGNQLIRLACMSNSGICGGFVNTMFPSTGGVNKGKLFNIVGTPQTPGLANVLALASGTVTGKVNFPMGVDVETDGSGKANVFFADYGNHEIRALCNTDGGVPLNHPCGGLTNSLTTLEGTGSPGYGLGLGLGSNPLRNPTDVKIDSSHNIVFADEGNHALQALCYKTSGVTDFCAGQGYLSDTLLAGISPAKNGPTPGDGGNGGAAANAQLTYPFLVSLSKQGDDTLAFPAGTNQSFQDNNIVFTERYLAGGNLSPDAPSAVVIRDGNSKPIGNVNTNTGPLGRGHDISVGTFFTCMMQSDGTNWCQGRNDSNMSQMGNSQAGSPIQSIPLKVPNVTITTGSNSGIVSGARHTCAWNASGSAVCWGDNSAGQLGLGGTTALPQPTSGQVLQPGVQPAPLPTSVTLNFTSIAAGDDFNCGVTNTVSGAITNSVFCWGNNSAGQLGCANVAGGTGACGTPGPTASPIPLSVEQTGPWTAEGKAGMTVNDIAAGANFACEEFQSGAGPTHYVSCWGEGSGGQLGNGGTSPLNAPSSTATLSGTKAFLLAAGGTHACAIDTSVAGNTNAIKCWGDNSKGALGTGGISTTAVTSPTAVLGLHFASNVSMITAGVNHTCASDGNTIECWGDNSSQQLGNDIVASSTIPMDVNGLPSGCGAGCIKQLQAGGYDTCALLQYSSGGSTVNQMACWGSNDYFQIGPNPIANGSSGNVVRIICGNNTGNGISGKPLTQGFCKGQQAGTIYKLAGLSGTLGNNNQNEGQYSQAVPFAGLYGLTYDLYKNVIVSTTGTVIRTTDPANPKPFTDFSLREIEDEVVGPLGGIKFQFTDSNTQTSNYCMRVRPLTSCDPDGSCACRIVAPTNDPDPNFWEAKMLTDPCP